MENNLKEVKTTVIGGILFLVGLIVFLVEYFTVGNLDWTHYIVPAVFLVGGVGFLLAPDKILNLILRKVSKNVGE